MCLIGTLVAYDVPALRHIQASPADLSWLWAALVGVIGSVVGGVIGGRYVLRAGQQQWQRDRGDARTDRSHRAAMSIAQAIARLEEAVVAWPAHRNDTIDLAAAYNAMAREAAVQSMALTDETLRSRVRNHVELAGRLVAVAQSSVASHSLPA